ncbi:hypothetical protein [Roseinatronobacter sp.]|uniref:hypothetical protein n=1 Tax=Roseinatronobacter sp. TaxID=1945755 RepID=UPI0025FF332E|nr:hypothetical protein [Roseibaca sp.]
MKPSEVVRAAVSDVVSKIEELDDSKEVQAALAKEAMISLFADFAEKLELDQITLTRIASETLYYCKIGTRDLQDEYHPERFDRD